MSREDPLHLPTDPDAHWTTVNLGEALPGVATPLGFSLWREAGDRMCRDVAYAIGVFDRTDRAAPVRDEDRIMSVFRGRIAPADGREPMHFGMVYRDGYGEELHLTAEQVHAHLERSARCNAVQRPTEG